MTTVAAETGSVDERIGFVVYMLMYRNQITQKVMANRLGIQQSSMSRKLRGTRPWLATEIVAVASILGVPPGDLMPGGNDPIPVPPTTPPASSNFTNTLGDELSSRRNRRSPAVPVPGRAPSAIPA